MPNRTDLIANSAGVQVSEITDADWRGVAAVALGSIIGDWIAMRDGRNPDA